MVIFLYNLTYFQKNFKFKNNYLNKNIYKSINLLIIIKIKITN